MKIEITTLRKFQLCGQVEHPVQGHQTAQEAGHLSKDESPAGTTASQPTPAQAIPSRVSGSVLYVSTGLKHFEVPDTPDYPNIYAQDVTIDRVAYRRLDGQYFAWLLLLKASIDRKHPRPAGWAALHVAWGVILGWVGDRQGPGGVAALEKAVDDMNRLDFMEKYQPPVVVWDRYEGMEKIKLKGICERERPTDDQPKKG